MVTGHPGVTGRQRCAERESLAGREAQRGQGVGQSDGWMCLKWLRVAWEAEEVAIRVRCSDSSSGLRPTGKPMGAPMAMAIPRGKEVNKCGAPWLHRIMPHPVIDSWDGHFADFEVCCQKSTGWFMTWKLKISNPLQLRWMILLFDCLEYLRGLHSY